MEEEEYFLIESVSGSLVDASYDSVYENFFFLTEEEGVTYIYRGGLDSAIEKYQIGEAEEDNRRLAAGTTYPCTG